MQVASPRNGSAPSSLSNKERAQVVIDRMADLGRLFEKPEFELVSPARWRHKPTGHHVETGYSYGEGRLRVFLEGDRVADADFVLSGREDDLDEFRKLIPVSSLVG